MKNIDWMNKKIEEAREYVKQGGSDLKLSDLRTQKDNNNTLIRFNFHNWSFETLNIEDDE